MNLKMKDRHLKQKTIWSRWVIRFCVGQYYGIFLERILLYNKLKNTCQSFHGESSTGCTQAIQLYYTIVNEPSVKQQKALKI